MNSPDLCTVFHAFLNAETYEDKENLLVALAEQAQKEWDATSLDMAEDIHSLHEDLQQATLQYRQAALRLGRMVADQLQSPDYDPSPMFSSNKTPTGPN